MSHVVAIVGPTAIGKSKLALELARSFNGEIISADSRQVYRSLDIGTAKPSKEELDSVPHHLIDVINPDEDFSLAQYQKLAYRALEHIHERGKTPFLVGGSGLYIWSVLEGWVIPEVPPDLEFRQKLEKTASETGTDRLYQELLEIDPEAARKIGRHNVRRIIRALEVERNTGIPFSELQIKRAPSFSTLIVGLTAQRVGLYRRIDLRVDEMIKRGLVEEVKGLLDMGYDLSLPALSGIGYRQIGLYLRGELPLSIAIQKIKFETHRFARHQYAWFRLQDRRIKWFDVEHLEDSEVPDLLAKFAGR